MENLTRADIIELLKTNEQNDALFSYADQIRKKHVGDEVHLRGLIEFSNICKRECKYCGLRFENKTIERYRIQPEDIIIYAKKAVDMGYKTVVLQSGEDGFYSQKTMCKIIEEIKNLDVDRKSVV